MVREAASSHGRVSDAAWDSAVGHGWSDEQLAEASGYPGPTVFTSCFLNYAATELDTESPPSVRKIKITIPNGRRLTPQPADLRTRRAR